MILIRSVPGAVFLSEGIQKFLFPQELAEGRFDPLGVPVPGFFGPFAGAAEIACGLLLLAGLLTRLATLPMIVNMVLALSLTKIPVLWGGSADIPDAAGFWDFAHEARTDYAILLTLVFLLIVGGGRWSADALLARRADG
ncbi:MAG: DoxX family protein [Pseudonocardiaceae bacterium]